MRKIFTVFVLGAITPAFLLSSSALASSLYTVGSVSGGTELNGYYTSAPSLNIQLNSSYPEPCEAQGGTVPGNGDLNVTLSPNLGNMDGSYDWQLLEDTNNHALVIKDVNNNYQTDVDSCNWNTPNPNYQVVWEQTIKYDMSAPTVSITSPANNANLASATTAVSGSVSDSASGVKSVTVNGVAASVSGGTFTANISLSMGLNALVATATDNAGHQTASSQVTAFRYENASSAASAGTGSNSTKPTSTNTPGSQKSKNNSLSAAASTNTPGSQSNPAKNEDTTKLTGNTKLVKNVAEGTGISLAGVLSIIILLLVLDRLGLIEIKLFHNYYEWRKKHYTKRKEAKS